MSFTNYVLVIDANKKPLSPCRPVIARKLLQAKKAAVFRLFPFVIILKKLVTAEPEPIALKIDPGSKTTGIALVQDNKVLFAAELIHRGQAIKLSLQYRRSLRMARRNRKTRYRKERFLNRKKPDGWLAPSLQHRVKTTITWVNRFIKLAPIKSIVQELVSFDLQQMEKPEILGIEYQQGTLHGYEVREYLLRKWERKCAYCNRENMPLQIEHIYPKSKGGTNRISNLCLACDKCNRKKGTQKIEEFLAKKPDVLKRILATTKSPLKDATAVNSTRWALFNRLKQTGLTVVTASGGLTKFNRTRLNLPKCHWLDAAGVGEVESLDLLTNQPLLIKATGHGTRQMCRTDKFGFPSRYVPRNKFVKGVQTGDIVKAIVLSGKKVGQYLGRVAVRSNGFFNVSTFSEIVQGISYKYCRVIHRKDGYNYAFPCMTVVQTAAST